MFVHIRGEHELRVHCVDSCCCKRSQKDSEEGEGALQGVPTTSLFVYNWNGTKQQIYNWINKANVWGNMNRKTAQRMPTAMGNVNPSDVSHTSEVKSYTWSYCICKRLECQVIKSMTWIDKTHKVMHRTIGSKSLWSLSVAGEIRRVKCTNIILTGRSRFVSRNALNVKSLVSSGDSQGWSEHQINRQDIRWLCNSHRLVSSLNFWAWNMGQSNDQSLVRHTLTLRVRIMGA